MSTYKCLIKSLKMMGRRLSLYMTGIFMMTAFNALFEVSGSFFMKIIFEAAGNGTLFGYSSRIIITIIAGICSIVIASFFMCIYNDEAKRMTLVMKENVFAKAMSLPYEYYEEHQSSEIISKMIYDTDTACNIYSSRLRRVLAPIIFVLVFVIAMVTINPLMTLILLILNILLFMANALLSMPMKKVGKQLSQKNALMTNIVSNILSGIEITKIYDVNHNGIKKYKSENTQYMNMQQKKVGITAVLDMLNTSFDLFCSLMFIVIGIILVQKKMATLGEIAAIFTLYTSLSFRFLQLGKNIPELVNCIAYADRIFEFLNLPEEKDVITVTDNQSKDTYEIHDKNVYAIECNNITFGYKGKNKLFVNESFQFPSNKIIAVTGTSGSGKSTLAKLLLGFYRLECGTISIMGKKLDDIGLEIAREKIAYIPQTPYLYNVSIKDNIRYGKPSASDEEIIEAAKLANAHVFIESLAEGYNTILDSRGSNLSGGQVQRIAMARAIVKNSPIILMDEATSALDNESEQLIAKSIAELKNRKTIIMIAHRNTTIKNADLVIKISSAYLL